MGNELGDLIRRKRKDRGWTQTQLADQIGVGQVAASDWETGKTLPRDLAAVRAALDITEDEYMAAVAAMVYDDPVAQHLATTTTVSAEVRDALLTLYREAVRAHRQRNDES